MWLVVGWEWVIIVVGLFMGGWGLKLDCGGGDEIFVVSLWKVCCVEVFSLLLENDLVGVDEMFCW